MNERLKATGPENTLTDCNTIRHCWGSLKTVRTDNKTFTSTDILSTLQNILSILDWAPM